MQLRAAKHHPAPAGCCTDVGRPLPLQKAATDNSCGKHAAISRGAARLRFGRRNRGSTAEAGGAVRLP